MRDLRESVDPGIRATGASRRRIGSEELASGAQNDALDRAVGVLLGLPAAISRAVVLERELPGRHATEFIGSRER
jgi:hypothetical protein